MATNQPDRQSSETSQTSKAAAPAGDALIAVAGPSGGLTAFERLADIPEEELWLQNHRSPHTRRA